MGALHFSELGHINLFINSHDDFRMLKYLDWVAKIHTDTPSKKSKISVDYIHVNALMGYVESTLVGGLLSLNLDRQTETAALLAFNKLLWIQNDFFAKYYCKDGVDAKASNSSNNVTLLGMLSDNSSVLLFATAGLATWFGYTVARYN